MTTEEDRSRSKLGIQRLTWTKRSRNRSCIFCCRYEQRSYLKRKGVVFTAEWYMVTVVVGHAALRVPPVAARGPGKGRPEA